MIFEVDKTCKKITGCRSYWNVKELELERYIISTAEEEEVTTLNSSVFRETLLLVSNQVKTKSRGTMDSGPLVVLWLGHFVLSWASFGAPFYFI